MFTPGFLTAMFAYPSIGSPAPLFSLPVVGGEYAEGSVVSDVWVEKSMDGKTYLETERKTFVIGAEGKLKEVLVKVKPAEHLRDLLAAPE